MRTPTTYLGYLWRKFTSSIKAWIFIRELNKKTKYNHKYAGKKIHSCGNGEIGISKKD